MNRQAEFNGIPLTVLAGTVKARDAGSSSAIRVAVEQIYVLSEYNPVRPNPEVPYRTAADIAVLKLNSSLGIGRNPNISKLQLPRKTKSGSYPTYTGKSAIVTGFGYNWISVYEDPETHKKYEFGGGSTDKLRFAETTVVSNEECGASYKAPIYPTHLCAGVKQRDPNVEEGVCSGDSGGPLVFNGNIVIGIQSNSPTGCTEIRAAGVYTRITSYIPFIRNVMSDRITEGMRVAILKDPKYL